MTDRMEAHNARSYSSSATARTVPRTIDYGARHRRGFARERMGGIVMPAGVKAVGGTVSRGLLYFVLTLGLMIAATAWLTDGFSKRPTFTWGHGFHTMQIQPPDQLR